MKKIVLVILLLCICVTGTYAQTTPKIRQLEERRTELRRQIAESETLLQSAKKDVKSQLDNLALLSGQIEERSRYIQTLETDMKSIQLEIDRLSAELSRLEKDLVDKREKYAQSVRYMYRNKSIQEKLMFVFSADNLNQMYRRMRYVREYADYQRLQGTQIKRKQELVEEKKSTLQASRQAKRDLLDQGKEEKLKLQEMEKERKALLQTLQKKQKGISAELNKKRRTAEKLNKEIDRLIEIEVKNARKRAEQEAKKKAEEEKKATLAEKDPDASGGTGKADAYRTDSSDRRLSGVFEKNKGILPMPITGSYVVVGHYGKYEVEGLRNVRLDNKGMDIKGKPGAKARAIFDGEVSAIFQYDGLTNVLVRHGSYISVYCNLSSVYVKKGSPVKTKDIIGDVNTDSDGNTVLHFQLRKETTSLNPELWIAR